MNLYYNLYSDKICVEDVLEVHSKKTSKWFNDIPPIAYGFKTIVDWFRSTKQTDGEGMPVTARVCPAIGQYLSRAIIAKLPTDMLIQTSQDGSFLWQVPDTCQGYTVSNHSEFQYTTQNKTNNLFDNLINIKIVLPVSLRSSKKLDLIFADPFYHTNTDYRTVPGILSIDDSAEIQLNVNLFFPKKDHTYYLKAGDPLCYLITGNVESYKLKQSTVRKPFFRRKYINSWSNK